MLHPSSLFENTVCQAQAAQEQTTAHALPRASGKTQFDYCRPTVIDLENKSCAEFVGRAKRVTGPYVDQHGHSMLEGGGTLVLERAGRCRGPGHCALLQEKNGDKVLQSGMASGEFSQLSLLKPSGPPLHAIHSCLFVPQEAGAQLVEPSAS